MKFSFSSISQYHVELQAGTVSCQQAVAHYLQQIANQQQLNSIVKVFAESATASALLLDEMIASGKPLLPLHGVVMTIKDVLCYQHHPVSAASKMLEGYHSSYSATAVQRLIDAGAIIIGSANCDEFAMGSTNENSCYGPALNAANEQHVPGGSSGGSAVSVQAGLCMAALGSDTGGSVRQPADFCGVVGLKPTYGRISRFGLIAYASSFDCIGILANNVADVASIYHVIAGPDGKDSTAMQQIPEVISLAKKTGRKMRFAYLEPSLAEGNLDEVIRTSIMKTLSDLEAGGNTVEKVPFPLLDYIVPAYYILTTAEASSNLGRFDGIRYGSNSSTSSADLTAFYKHNRSMGFGKEVQRRIMLGSFVLSSGYVDAYFTKAQQVRQMIIDATRLIFNRFDAIIMPVSPTTAPPLGQAQVDLVATYMADIFTVFANLAGVPAMAIPLYKHPNGLPFGLQVITNHGNEVALHEICDFLLSGFISPNQAQS